MRKEVLSTEDNIIKLRTELSDLYEDARFLQGNTMGDLLATGLRMLEAQQMGQNKINCRMSINSNRTKNIVFN